MLDGGSEHHGSDVNVELVGQATRGALTGDVGAEHLQVLAARSVKSCLDCLGDVAVQERHGAIRHGVLGMMGQHEDRAAPCTTVGLGGRLAGLAEARIVTAPASQDRAAGGDHLIEDPGRDGVSDKPDIQSIEWFEPAMNPSSDIVTCHSTLPMLEGDRDASTVMCCSSGSVTRRSLTRPHEDDGLIGAPADANGIRSPRLRPRGRWRRRLGTLPGSCRHPRFGGGWMRQSWVRDHRQDEAAPSQTSPARPSPSSPPLSLSAEALVCLRPDQGNLRTRGRG